MKTKKLKKDNYLNYKSDRFSKLWILLPTHPMYVI